MDTELIDGAACAAADLTARLHAELTQAQAQLAIADARAHAILSRGEEIPTDVRADRVLHRQKVAVLNQVLDGVPAVEADLDQDLGEAGEGDCHAASA